MQVLACNSCPVQSNALGLGTPKNRLIGRRQLCFDGVSSASSHSQSNRPTHSSDGAVPPFSISTQSSVQELSKDFDPLVREAAPFTTRRALFASIFMYPLCDPSRYLSAQALGDPTVTIEEVTPPVLTSGPLFPIEERIVQLFEKNTYSVVNIFDVTLRPQLNITGVVEVEASEDLLKPISVGHSSSLRVGQQCLAIGNPFGFDHTLTVGVISGLNRDIFSQAGVTISGGIQTDAAINPGNSGGPLLDSKGNLIGINTAIFTQTGTSAGVGFAIPSSTVLKIVPQLIQFGKVVRAGLNLEIAPELVANQLNVRYGALVLQVPANSVAAKAGILPTTRGFAGNIVLGDIIVAVDDKPVKSKAEFNRVLDEYNVGDKVTLKIQRSSENLELPITLEEKSS